MSDEKEMTPEVQAEAEAEVAVEVSDELAGLTPEEIHRKTHGFTPQEAALELGGESEGWTGKRLRRYIRAGTCPAQKVKGRWFILVEELEVLLTKLAAQAEAKVKAEAEAKAAAAAVPEAPTPEAPVPPAPSAEYPV